MAGFKGEQRWGALVGVLYLAVLTAASSWAAVLENPSPGRLYSGIGVISGWKCEAGELTVRFNGGDPIPLLYGAERQDVQTAGACDQANVGFVTIWNWGNLGDGEHEAIAYDDGEEFGRATFTVGSTGEAFLKGAGRAALLENFPTLGDTTELEWNEASQHFEIRGLVDSTAAGKYDVAYWRRVVREIELGTYRTAEFLYDEEPDPDTCQAGRLSQAAKDRALEAMNQIRGLNGVAPVRWSELYSQQVQEAALIQAAEQELEHFPERSAKCYTALGAAGSSGSNLFLGGVVRDPVWAVVGWANDYNSGTAIPAVGHRRWMLNPFAAYMSYGQVGRAAVQKVTRFEDEAAATPHIPVNYIAFPYKTFPFLLVEGDPPWSFSVIEDKTKRGNNKHPYFEGAGVSVVRVKDGVSLRITDRYTDTRGIGVPNVLSWEVKGWEYDTLYEVEISNVSMQSGATQSYSYPVFIDRANIEY